MRPYRKRHQRACSQPREDTARRWLLQGRKRAHGRPGHAGTCAGCPASRAVRSQRVPCKLPERTDAPLSRGDLLPGLPLQHPNCPWLSKHACRLSPCFLLAVRPAVPTVQVNTSEPPAGAMIPAPSVVRLCQQVSPVQTLGVLCSHHLGMKTPDNSGVARSHLTKLWVFPLPLGLCTQARRRT